MPEGLTSQMEAELLVAMEEDVEHYCRLIDMGAKPEQARAVLGNCTKTEFIWSANLREIRHFLKLRTGAGAQPDIARLARIIKKMMEDAGLGVFVEDVCIPEER